MIALDKKDIDAANRVMGVAENVHYLLGVHISQWREQGYGDQQRFIRQPERVQAIEATKRVLDILLDCPEEWMDDEVRGRVELAMKS